MKYYYNPYESKASKNVLFLIKFDIKYIISLFLG